MTAGEGALLLAAYGVGSIPFGFLVGRRPAGVDVRQVGSGNVGATNVLRAAGPAAGALTLLLDFVKGWAPVVVAHTLGSSDAVQAMIGLAAVRHEEGRIHLRSAHSAAGEGKRRTLWP